VASGAIALSFRARQLVLTAGGLGLAAWLTLAYVKVGAEVSDRYWGTDDRFARYRESYRGPAALVLVAFRTPWLPRAERTFPWTAVPIPGWTNDVRSGAALAQNDPLLQGPLVFGKYHPALVEPVRQRFPGRQLLVYFMGDGPGDDLVMRAEDVVINGAPAPPAENFGGFVFDPIRRPR
jgi:hypothetical protein